MASCGGTETDDDSFTGENRSGEDSMIETSRANETRRNTFDLPVSGTVG